MSEACPWYHVHPAGADVADWWQCGGVAGHDGAHRDYFDHATPDDRDDPMWRFDPPEETR